jgi:hypothetical protein
LIRENDKEFLKWDVQVALQITASPEVVKITVRVERMAAIN